MRGLDELEQSRRFDFSTDDTLLSFSHYWNANTSAFATSLLLVYVDGVQVYSASSPRGWFPSALIPLSAGFHEVTFRYAEDGFSSEGCMCVRIDDITLIPN